MKNRVLQRGEVAALRLKRGEAIRCEAGSVWLTFEGDHADYFLTAGQSRTSPRGAKAVLQALSQEARWNFIPITCAPSPLEKKGVERTGGNGGLNSVLERGFLFALRFLAEMSSPPFPTPTRTDASRDQSDIKGEKNQDDV